MKCKKTILAMVSILVIFIMPAVAEESTYPGGYLPHNLTVCAVDVFGNVNTSTNIQVVIVKNGDVSKNGDVTLYDAMYLARHIMGKSGFEPMNENIGEVSGNGAVTLYDAMYLAKHIMDESGFGALR